MDAYHILIVDDNEINLLVLRTYFNKDNVQLTIARDGNEALQLASKKNYDCILMDIAMPIMDGIDATKIIRKNEKTSMNKHRTPIIAVTASDPVYNQSIFKEAGFDDFVSKPVCPIKLKKKICRYTKVKF